jgi:hypothetical protein
MRPRSCFVLLALASVLCASDVAKFDFQPGTLTRERLKVAAEAAGFQVAAIQARIPATVHSRFPFTTFEYDDPLLQTLRREYPLEKVVSGAPDEWTAQLRLKDWVFRQLPGGNPRHSPKNALEVLKLAAQGERFYCTQYAITYHDCAQAVGWQTRKISVDRKHGPVGMQSSHHGVAEVWSNQFCKWVVIDPQSNLHFEKKGIPLSAWEIRAEWLKNKGADVDHVVGAPPNTAKKNPAMVWRVPDDDEIATYFWVAIEDHADLSKGSRRIFPQDGWNEGEVWYQNNDQTKGGQLHQGYIKNLFMPTDRIEDAYWTVGIIEVKLTGVASGAIRMSLDSYCPNRTAYELSRDGRNWEDVKNEGSLEWKLAPGWNMLRLRTASRGGVRGPETAIVMCLTEREKK